VGRRLKALARDDSPLDVPAPRSETRGARWVEPRLVAEVEYTEVTSDGRLRHPSFQGLREDKEAEQVVIEKPAPAPTADAAKRPTTRAKSAKKSPSRRGRGSDTPGRAGEDRVVVGGVAISNPGRVLYPEQGQTKLDLARYYESMAERILPHIEGRPLSTVRCPQGRAKQCFFQKHIRESFGDAVRPIEVMEKDGKAEYISVESPEGLLSLVQFGVLEIHPWGARGANLDKPDTLTFDLDPGEGATLDQVKEAALRVRDVLGALDLETFLKASGGKGLHVVLPLRPYAGWDDAKEFCERIAKMIAAEEPEKYLAKMSKAARKGKVFIDWLRNSRGATSIAPFSTRARAGAPVAMPLRWADLRTLESPSQFTIGNSPARMKRLKKDPWEGYFGVKQRLTAAHLKAARQA
jgi:bifunctional non-homologous end joining protein LigD